MRKKNFYIALSVVLLIGVGTISQAQTISHVTSTTNGSTVTCEFTVEVPQGGTTINDVHIDPPNRMKFDRPPCPSNVTSPTDWGENFTSERYSMWADGHAGISPGQKHTFSMDLIKGSNDFLIYGQCTWYLTKNGEKDFKLKKEDVFDTGRNGENGSPFNLPVKYINCSVNPGSSSGIGETFILYLVTSEPGYAYQVFLSTAALLPNVQDLAGQSIEIDTANPPPQEWGLVVRRQRGAFRMDDRSAQCEILIPYRTELVGRIFYAVGAIDLDSDRVFDIYTEPEKIEIRNS